MIVTLFNTVYSDFFKRPYITTDFNQLGKYGDHSTYYLISIHNQGLEPAKNLTLTITSDGIPMHAAFFFAKENVTHVSLFPDYMLLKATRFAQGKGNLLQIHTIFTRSPPDIKKPVIVYATYNQGSLACSYNFVV